MECMRKYALERNKLHKAVTNPRVQAAFKHLKEASQPLHIQKLEASNIRLKKARPVIGIPEDQIETELVLEVKSRHWAPPNWSQLRLDWLTPLYAFLDRPMLDEQE